MGMLFKIVATFVVYFVVEVKFSFFFRTVVLTHSSYHSKVKQNKGTNR